MWALRQSAARICKMTDVVSGGAEPQLSPADYPLANELLIETYYGLSHRKIFYPAALSS
jgi:hypothetical protein